LNNPERRPEKPDIPKKGSEIEGTASMPDQVAKRVDRIDAWNKQSNQALHVRTETPKPARTAEMEGKRIFDVTKADTLSVIGSRIA